jgi:hypothetical protein
MPAVQRQDRPAVESLSRARFFIVSSRYSERRCRVEFQRTNRQRCQFSAPQSGRYQRSENQSPLKVTVVELRGEFRVVCQLFEAAF